MKVQKCLSLGSNQKIIISSSHKNDDKSVHTNKLTTEINKFLGNLKLKNKKYTVCTLEFKFYLINIVTFSSSQLLVFDNLEDNKEIIVSIHL